MTYQKRRRASRITHRSVSAFGCLIILSSISCDDGRNIKEIDIESKTLALSSRTIDHGGGDGREPSGRYGRALATGDFNNDGFNDVAVGVPYNDTSDGIDSGYVEIWWGGVNGTGRHGREYFSQNSISGASREARDKLGISLVSGDFDNDGTDDLAVGMPGKNIDGMSNAGMVAIMYGSRTGLIPPRSQIIKQGDSEFASSEAGDQFGWALAAGDFNGDGIDDLVVGSPTENVGGDTDCGSITVFFGRSTGLSTSSTENLTENSVAGLTRAAGDQFGRVLATGDFNGDGIDDLAVGSPYYDARGVNGSGAAAILMGSRSGLLPANSITLQQAASRINTSDQFGLALATGDMNGDGLDELAVGAPYDRELGHQAGAVMLYAGARTGVLGMQRINKADLIETTIGRMTPNQDEFGYSLTMGDFDNDDLADLAIGIPYHDTFEARNVGATGIIFGDESFARNRVDVVTQKNFLRIDQTDFDRFGLVLAAANVDDEEEDELIFGVPYKHRSGIIDSGAVYVRTPTPALPISDGEAAIVMTRDGRVLAGNNAEHRRAMASTTKIMTTLLVLEWLDENNLGWSKTVTVSQLAADTTGSCLDIECEGDPLDGLQAGDQINVRDLLYGLMLESANEAAMALAEFTAGDIPTFVEWMNVRAKELGLDDTHYVNPHGRDPWRRNACGKLKQDCERICSENDTRLDNGPCSHYTTARDLADLTRFALGADPMTPSNRVEMRFRRIAGTGSWTSRSWRRKIAGSWVSQDFPFCNSNRFIDSCSSGNGPGYVDRRFTTAGVTVSGVKTGTTPDGGSCLVTAATDGNRNLISVILGGATTRYTPTAEALDYAFGLPGSPLVSRSWQSNAVFQVGDRVNIESRIFEANWWTTANPLEANGTGQPWTEITLSDPSDSEDGDGLCSQPAWSTSKTYVAGEQVSLDGIEYIANYWTQDDPRLASGNGSGWSIGSPCSAELDAFECQAPTWTPSATYVAGQTVSYEGYDYTARWWTNVNPQFNYGGENSGAPWSEPISCQ